MVIAFPQDAKMTARFWIEWLKTEANKQNNFISGEKRVKTAVESGTYIFLTTLPSPPLAPDPLIGLAEGSIIILIFKKSLCLSRYACFVWHKCHSDHFSGENIPFHNARNYPQMHLLMILRHPFSFKAIHVLSPLMRPWVALQRRNPHAILRK